MKKFVSVMLGILLALPGVSYAAWPSKTITMIVPFAAGGTADASGRLMARELEKKLGANIIVKNVAGATGTIGAAEVARSKPDGYTMGWFTPGATVGMLNMRELPYTRDSFRPVGMMFEEVSFFTTAKNAPWKTLDDLVADVRSKPDQYVMGAPGRGGAVHLSIYTMLKALGLECRFVPERSNADVLKSIAGGTTNFHAAQGSELQRFDLKAFFVVDDARNRSFPDIPTAKELGYDIPRITNWYGLFVPKDVPDEIVSQIEKAMGEIGEDPKFKETSEQMACTVHHLSAKEFTAFYNEQFDIYAALLKQILDK